MEILGMRLAVRKNFEWYSVKIQSSKQGKARVKNADAAYKG
jgi:hypothetical protein